MKSSKQMLSLLAATIVIGTQNVKAEESYYVVNNAPTKGEVEVSYARQNQINNGIQAHSTKTNSNQFQLKYTHALDENLSASIGSSFNMGQRSSAGTDGSQISGMGDLNLGIKAGKVFDALTMVYGADVGISPGSARNSYTLRDENNQIIRENEGNYFSGHNQLSPFIGIESYYKNIAVGARFTYAYYSITNIEDASANTPNGEIEVGRASAYRLQGFVEFPVDKKADVGFLAGIGREDGNLVRFVDRQRGSEYQAKIYSHYHLDKDTRAVLAFESVNTQVPYETTNSQVQLGLRRSL